MMRNVLTCGLLLVAALYVQTSEQKSECETKRESAQKLVDSNAPGLAIVVPNCNPDGSYASLQCHHGSQFCQCWDKEGTPLTQPKKSLKKCECHIKRATDLKKVSPSEVGSIPVTSCETDGSYTAKQCNTSACWCVNPDTGAKIGSEAGRSSPLKC